MFDDRQIAQRLKDGLPSFRPCKPRPGRYDELKPAGAAPFLASHPAAIDATPAIDTDLLH
jgi:hypothetical protein